LRGSELRVHERSTRNTAYATLEYKKSGRKIALALNCTPDEISIAQTIVDPSLKGEAIADLKKTKADAEEDLEEDMEEAQQQME
jgi:hypothetical protein